MKNVSPWPWVNLAAFLVVVVVNILANALPLNGISTGEISDKFKVYLVPAGYVFSIWGLIYLLLAIYVAYSFTPQGREWGNVGWLFAFSCLANVVWLFLWHYGKFPWTLVAMLALLGSLIAIYLRLGIRYPLAAPAGRWLIQLPFSLYLGWVSVATIVNVSDVLYIWGWNGGGLAPQLWAILMMAAAVILAILMVWTRGDWVYGAVVVWALAGIGVKQTGIVPVSVAAWIMTLLSAVGVVAIAIWRAVRRGA